MNGLVDPVGVDPDGVSFAWTMQATGRSVMQTAYQVVVRRTDPGHERTVWDSGPVLSAQQAFVGVHRASLWSADAAYEWTVQPRGYAERWGADVRPGPLHHRAARRRLAGPLAATGRRLVTTRPRDLSPRPR